MATSPPSNSPLPTVWFPPPQQLLTASYRVTIEPAPLAISAVFASLVLIMITLIAQRKKKGNHLDDIMKDNDREDLELHDRPEHESLEPPPHHASLRSDSSHHNRAVHETDQHTLQSQTVEEQGRAPDSRWSAPGHHRERGLYDDTTLADDNDSGTLRSEPVYSNFESMRSNEYIASEAQSVAFSEFVPLDPSVVGMHDKVWK